MRATKNAGFTTFCDVSRVVKRLNLVSSLESAFYSKANWKQSMSGHWAEQPGSLGRWELPLKESKIMHVPMFLLS